ncbi:response regulator [Desulfobacula sp.]|uniref:response regulator n=1 Tax=Desulfobacula sp. TaxID=2593537 RepID=UPI0025C11D11|nr:response regulator [Desulfobacula sp.]MBC2705829.1 response regulator [Desulfobacula sp.]
MKQILIIDDEASIRKMLKKLFEKNGYAVIDAQDGSQGVKLFKEHEPDLIITDLIMPEKEGLETISEIKKINPDTKIIAMSGGGVVEPEMYLDLAKNFGAQYSFNKPIDNEALLAAVKHLMSN